MFKNYLRTQPTGIQLLILLAFWSVLQLLFLMALPTILKSVVGLQFEDYKQFVGGEMYKYPNIVIGINAWGSVVTFLFPALIFVYLADPAPSGYLGLNRPRKTGTILLAIMAGVFIVPFINVIGGLIKELDLGVTADELEKQREKMIALYLSSGSVWKMLGNVFYIALIPAICEEVFFRGVVQRFTHSWLKKWWLSIGLSSVLFSIFHASVYEFVPILLAGILLGWVYYITGNLWLSIILHFINNGLQVVIAYYATPGLEKSLEQPVNLALILAGAGVLLGACIYGLYRQRTPLPDNWRVFYKEPVKEED
jgi:membrane protease YdiL (CAAX protease family)